MRPRVEQATVATFVADAPLEAGGAVTLGEEAAHHMRVRRLDVNDRVALRDGAGRSGEGRLARLAKNHAVVELTAVRDHPPPPPVHLLVPVADKDRMLWLAEKAVEIGVASWRPVLFRRSRSVGARGEGPAFQQKVRARMLSALAQSEAAWVPDLHPEAPLDRALAAAPAGPRWICDPDGGALLDAAAPAGAPVTIAVGPEGGIEPDELAAFHAAGFRSAALPGNILRFETAAVVAAALARALVERAGPPP
ncbi:RsmE family RNA methyltransferase [Roseisolibacter sp. H3M3-2]|uniref:RsmE family RNA methyltransferase n=1 Tax=Roseisolibacter sp. H3M3-2 TaxID=3031323 RepID=UPI0023DCBA54|nr:RsmE family RNA methyltransferase [Roseisolibacter sp. H3M3-2]MDF1502199.1 RsmE family RNA methyltransferase [Roseisolibacter sp. H3M3-2]